MSKPIVDFIYIKPIIEKVLYILRVIISKKPNYFHILKLRSNNNIVIAPANTGSDIINKIAVINTDQGNREI